MSVEIRTYASPLTGDVECFSYTYDITDKKRNEQIMNRIATTEFDYVGLIFERDGIFKFLQKAEGISFPAVHSKTAYTDCCDYVRKKYILDDELQQFDDAVSLTNILAGLDADGRWSSTYHRIEKNKFSCKQLDYSWFDKGERIILVVRTDISASYQRDQEQISQMKAAKLEADRANESKSAFLSSMSHDMRTPLNAVLGFTDLALNEINAQVKQEYLKKIQSSGNLLLDLVNDTLELSRIESGKLTLTPEAVDGWELWESVVNSLQPAADLKKIALLTEQPAALRETIWIDRLKLQKILLNLISNAIKYTPVGGTVRVTVERLDPPDKNGCTRRITVEDNGIGISPDFLPRVFDPFSQEHRDEIGNVPGTGLGLAIIKRIVDLMGGTIHVQSKLHCGTRFTVDLPISPAKNEEVHSRKSEFLSVLSGGKILLCEDNDLNAEIVTILLREKNIEVERAKNGSLGVQKFSDSMVGYYDAILMDIRMPVLDGYGATKKIRALPRLDAKNVPIVAMSADAFEEDIRRARESGMDEYLTKPVDPKKLCRTLAEAVSGKKDNQREER